MIGKYTKFPIQLSSIERSIYGLRNYYFEDEETIVGVHSTSQPDEYQPLENHERKIYCPSGTSGLLQTVLIVYLVRPSILHGLVLLHYFSLQRSTAINTLRNTRLVGNYNYSFLGQVQGALNLTYLRLIPVSHFCIPKLLMLI